MLRCSLGPGRAYGVHDPHDRAASADVVVGSRTPGSRGVKQHVSEHSRSLTDSGLAIEWADPADGRRPMRGALAAVALAFSGGFGGATASCTPPAPGSRNVTEPAPDASRFAFADGGTSVRTDDAGGSANVAALSLPPLPPGTGSTNGSPLSTSVTQEPPCPPQRGWNGATCVATTCPSPLRFRTGRGCVHEDGMPTDVFPALGNAYETQFGSPDSAPFDRKAVGETLAKLNLATCKVDGDPTGAGHITLTFLPAGDVERAVVDQPFAGTTSGKCIARLFKSVRVPKFKGAPVTVGQSFLLQ